NAAGNDNIRLRPGAAQPFSTSFRQMLQVHPRLPFVGSNLVSGQLLRSFRFRRLLGDGFAAQSPRPRSCRVMGRGEASCLCDVASDGVAARAAPAPRETPRNHSDIPADPPPETPYTLYHTPDRSIAPRRPLIGQRAVQLSFAGSRENSTPG